MVYQGTVVTHLDLGDWSDLHGYRLMSFADRDFANSGERTELSALPPKSIPFNRKQTIMGIPAPAAGPMTPIVASVIKMIG